MIHMKWNVIAAALALCLLLPACGARGEGDPTANAQPTLPDAAQTATAGEPDPGPEGEPAEPRADSPDPAPAQTPEPEPEPEPIVGLVPEGEPVEEDWFADAAFLGDSRTDGLRLYSGMKGAAFFSYKGLSVFSIDEKKCIDVDGKKVTALEALAQGEYAKVYVMLGINELGYQNTGAFKDAYRDLVLAIREIEPDADIYLQLQTPVNEAVAGKKGMADYFNNERIALFNGLITEVAEEQETALVNVWEALADENGALPADLTTDGVHMKRAGYETWYAYLRTHTGTTPEVTPGGGEPPAEEPAQGLPADAAAQTEGAGTQETVQIGGAE